jgi:hypothetical protein
VILAPEEFLVCVETESLVQPDVEESGKKELNSE